MMLTWMYFFLFFCTGHAHGDDSWLLRGQVGTLFTAQPGVAQEGVTVKLRGRSEQTLTNAKGLFLLKIPRLRGKVTLEFSKPGYHPAILSVRAGESSFLRTRLASRNAFDQISQRLGILQGSRLGVLLGKSAVSGLSVRLTQQSEGPFYFDDRGVPTRGLRATSSDGRFLFLNVSAGSGFLEAELEGEPIAPMQVSFVEGGQLLQKNLKPTYGSLRGRFFEAIAEQRALVGARVRIEGSAEWVPTDSYGAFQFAHLRWMKGEKLPLMFSLEGFRSHRYQVSADEQPPQQLFAFSSFYLERLARAAKVELDSEAGIVVGRSAGKSVRIDALAEHSPTNKTRDFYFDANGRMRAPPAMTNSRFGTFLLFNVPPGKALLLGSDAAGDLRFSHSIFAGPSVVNVEVEN